MSKYAISVISGEAQINQGTEIYSQPYLINCFLSNLRINNSSLHSIEFERVYILVASSTLVLENTSLREFYMKQDGAIFKASNSQISVLNMSYSESNAQLLISSSAEVYAENLIFNSIINANTLMKIDRSQKSRLNNLKVLNCSVLGNRMFIIDKCYKLMISNMSVSYHNRTLFMIRDSDVELIYNLKVSHYYRAIELTKSSIKQISNSDFSNCGGDNMVYAGAVLIRESNATFFNTTFSQNRAISGAAITSLCLHESNCNLKIQRSVFRMNSAIEKGGAIYYNYRPPVVDKSTIFVNNTASYGNNYASYPVVVGPTNRSLLGDIIIDQVSSGIVLNQGLHFSLYDGNFQVMNLDNSTKISITAVTQKSSIKGFNVRRMRAGSASFSNLIPVGQPGTSGIKFKILSKSIDKVKVKNAFDNLIVQPEIIINFSYCKPGERSNDNECYECPAGTYSFKWNSTECHQCEDNAACLGKEKMEIAKGYWRSSTNSTKIVECIRKNACEGGYHPENEHPVQCATGYTGKLCSKCKVTEESKYQKIHDFQCQICPDPILNAIRVIGLVLLVFLFFMVVIIANVRKTHESNFSVLLKILTNYLQIITTSMSMTTKYPSSLTDIFTPLNRIGSSSDTFLSFDCFVINYEVKGFFDSNSVLKLFLNLMLPLILFSIVALIWFIVRVLHKQWVKDIKRNLIISFTSILFILHPKLTESGINAFRCVTVDGTTHAARFDTDIDCYSFTHLKWCVLIAVPILVIWAAMFPLIGLLILHKARKKGNNTILGYFLILSQGFKDEMFFWEYINTLRKVLIVMAFLLPNNYKIGTSIIVLVVSERLERKFSPYKSYDNNRLAMLSSVAGIITLNASYVYEKDERINNLNSCILIMIVFINAKFIIEWAYLLLKCFKSKYKVIEYAFLLASKVLCKKISDEEPNDETQTVQNAHKILINIPSKHHKKFKRKKKRKRIKKLACKR